MSNPRFVLRDILYMIRTTKKNSSVIPFIQGAIVACDIVNILNDPRVKNFFRKERKTLKQAPLEEVEVDSGIPLSSEE